MRNVGLALTSLAGLLTTPSRAGDVGGHGRLEERQALVCTRDATLDCLLLNVNFGAGYCSGYGIVASPISTAVQAVTTTQLATVTATVTITTTRVTILSVAASVYVGLDGVTLRVGAGLGSLLGVSATLGLGPILPREDAAVTEFDARPTLEPRQLQQPLCFLGMLLGLGQISSACACFYRSNPAPATTVQSLAATIGITNTVTATVTASFVVTSTSSRATTITVSVPSSTISSSSVLSSVPSAVAPSSSSSSSSAAGVASSSGLSSAPSSSAPSAISPGASSPGSSSPALSSVSSLAALPGSSSAGATSSSTSLPISSSAAGVGSSSPPGATISASVSSAQALSTSQPSSSSLSGLSSSAVQSNGPASRTSSSLSISPSSAQSSVQSSVQSSSSSSVPSSAALSSMSQPPSSILSVSGSSTSSRASGQFPGASPTSQSFSTSGFPVASPSSSSSLSSVNVQSSSRSSDANPSPSAGQPSSTSVPTSSQSSSGGAPSSGVSSGQPSSLGQLTSTGLLSSDLQPSSSSGAFSEGQQRSSSSRSSSSFATASSNQPVSPSISPSSVDASSSPGAASSAPSIESGLSPGTPVPATSSGLASSSTGALAVPTGGESLADSSTLESASSTSGGTGSSMSSSISASSSPSATGVTTIRAAPGDTFLIDAVAILGPGLNPADFSISVETVPSVRFVTFDSQQGGVLVGVPSNQQNTDVSLIVTATSPVSSSQVRQFALQIRATPAITATFAPGSTGIIDLATLLPGALGFSVEVGTVPSVSWVTFDAEADTVSVRVPANQPDGDIDVTATAVSPTTGDIQVRRFKAQIRSAAASITTVAPGELFAVEIDSFVSNPSAYTITTYTDPSAPWIRYDAPTNDLVGLVPVAQPDSDIVVTVSAVSKDSGAVETRQFSLAVRAGVGSSTTATPGDAFAIDLAGFLGNPSVYSVSLSSTPSVDFFNYDAARSSIVGTIPADSPDQTINITATATSRDGGVLTRTFPLRVVAGVSSTTVTAPGSNFAISLSSFLASASGSSSVSVTSQPLVDWINYDARSKAITGTTPSTYPDATLNITVTATSPSGTVRSRRFALRVLAEAGIPTSVEAGIPFSIPVGSLLVDPAGFSVLLATDPLVNWVSYDPRTNAISGTPPLSFDGRVNVTITATAPNGSVFSRPFPLQVEGVVVDVPVTAVPGGTFSIDVGDIVRDPTDATVVLVTQPTDASGWIAYDPKTNSLTGTVPTDTPSGPVTITATVTTGAGEVRTREYTLDISSKPLTVPVAVVAPGETFSVSIKGQILDPASVSVSLSADPSSATVWVSYDPVTNALSGVVPSDVADGLVNVTVTATSPTTGKVSTERYTLEVRAASASPIAPVAPGGQFTLDLGGFVLNATDSTVSISTQPVDATNWMAYAATTNLLSGVVPTGVPDQDVVITVTSTSKTTGVTQTKRYTLPVRATAAFSTTTLEAGAPFTIPLADFVTQPSATSVTLTIEPVSASARIAYDTQLNAIVGTAPTGLPAGTILNITVAATSAITGIVSSRLYALVLSGDPAGPPSSVTETRTVGLPSSARTMSATLPLSSSLSILSIPTALGSSFLPPPSSSLLPAGLTTRTANPDPTASLSANSIQTSPTGSRNSNGPIASSSPGTASVMSSEMQTTMRASTTTMTTSRISARTTATSTRLGPVASLLPANPNATSPPRATPTEINQVYVLPSDVLELASIPLSQADRYLVVVMPFVLPVISSAAVV